MKKVLILIFILLAVFIMPSFASPTGGGDSVAEYSIPSFFDAEFSVTESQAKLPIMEFNFIVIENIVPVSRSKMHILSMLSAMETNIKLKSVEELMLRKTTINELSGNLIRYVRLAA